MKPEDFVISTFLMVSQISEKMIEYEYNFLLFLQYPRDIMLKIFKKIKGLCLLVSSDKIAIYQVSPIGNDK